MSLFGVTATGALSAFNTALKNKAQKAGSSIVTPSIEKAREQLRTAAAGFVASFLELTGTRKTVFNSSLVSAPPKLVEVSGIGARVSPIVGSPSILQATQRINTRTSSERESSSALGLDLSSAAASVLRSMGLGLDVTSASAPSRLTSSAGLGLDLVTPAAASSLASSAALGLDLTSPNAPSVLGSSATLGLDVTSPETASVLGSSATLGLDVTSPETASTISSTTEMNTMATSYGSPLLAFSGSGQASTATATLSGTFTGTGAAANATSLTFKITKAGIIFQSTNFDVLDQNNNVLFSYEGGVEAGQPVFLGNDIGLTVTFSAGSLTKNHTATTTVSHDPTTVDANATFNDANTNLRPRFENGAQVTAGSFTVNGTSITVNANDSINSVVARINASAAGVTATVANDRVTLTGTSISEDNIVLGGDTSGFLSAVKLSGAATVRGNIRDDEQVLAKTSQFAGVASGSFTINGVSITVDRNTDTVASIVSRINGAGAGVTAAYDAAQDKLVLTGTSNSEDLIAVGGDNTGFLTAAKLATNNTARGNLRDDEQVLAKTSQFGAVATGSFSINGASISVDKDTDTLSTIIARINTSNAGVTATYDSGSDKLVLTGTAHSQDLITVDGDTSGFLDAAHLATANTDRGHLPEDGVALANIDEFQSVVNGSFVIDGKTIAVNAATDTVQSIVTKINQSGARVVAAYDAGTDRIALQATYNSEDDVAIGSDTSGFLAAANLSAVNSVRGNLRDDLQVLSKTSQFGSVTNGSFTINGAAITIDTATDSVATVVTKINNANAGVTASLNAATNKIELTGTLDSEDLIDVDNDATGFLAAAQLSTNNTVRGNLADDSQVLSKMAQFADVTSGSFTINGQAIAVDVDTDTVTSLVGKINGANTGVTAAYDTAADALVLTGNAASEDDIVLADDTTGLLAARGLTTANTTRGNIADDVQVLSKTTQFASVADGSFRVNGATITVDRSQDSVQSILDKINNAGVDVSAAYDSGSDTIVLSPTVAGAPLALDGDTSGFLAAANIAAGAVGTRVNPDAAFNGTGLDSPLFDPGFEVHAGSFTVNGVTINVAANDTVNTVATKISVSNAGVMARYDDATQTMRLVTSQPTAAPIALGNDTSGFLAAVKLDGSEQSTVGSETLSAFTTPLGDMAEYAGVQAGTVTVNGTAVAIDPRTSTVRGFIASLAMIRGISAVVDEETGDVTILSTKTGTTVTLSDTSGLLSALGIAAGAHKSAFMPKREIKTEEGEEITSNASSISANVMQAAVNLNEAFERLGDMLKPGSQERSRLEIAMRRTLSALGASGVEGLRFTSSASGMKLDVDRGELTRSLNANAESLAKTMASYSDIGGTLGSLLDTLTNVATGTSQPTSIRQLSRADLNNRIKMNFDGEVDLTSLRLVVRSTLLSQGAAAQAYADVERSFEQGKSA